jgi:hypothetical protein
MGSHSSQFVSPKQPHRLTSFVWITQRQRAGYKNRIFLERGAAKKAGEAGSPERNLGLFFPVNGFRSLTALDAYTARIPIGALSNKSAVSFGSGFPAATIEAESLSHKKIAG